MCNPWIVEVIASIEAGEPPVDAGLVRVVVGARLGEGAAPVERDDGMQVRPLIRPGDRGEDRVCSSGPVHRQGACLRVQPRRQWIRLWRRSHRGRAIGEGKESDDDGGEGEKSCAHG